MARYMETAAEANGVAITLMELIPDADRPKAAEMLARLVNLGIRCSPRGVQHTVRLNAVRAAVRGLPVKVGMIEKRDEKTERTYNLLTTQPVYTDGDRYAGTVSEPHAESAGADD